MTETLGERLPDALKRIGHFLGSDQTQKVKSEFVADIMAIFVAVDSQAAEIDRLRGAVAYLRANVKPPAPDHPAWCWPDVWAEFERRVDGE